MTDLFEISETVESKAESGGFDSLTKAEQTFYTVWCFEAELNNGGFDQFFYNSIGDHSLQTIAALDHIGASQCADLLRRACAIFPDSSPSSDCELRQDQLEAITEQNEDAFEELDAQFLEYPDDLADLLAQYWQSSD